MSDSSLVPAPGGLPSIERARVLLTQCRSVQEVMKVKALAAAVASCANAEGARDEAAAIVLLAKARIGELTAEIPKAHAKGAGRGVGAVPAGSTPKSATLAAEGVSRKEAAECEKLAALKRSGDLDKLIAKGGTTTASAVALARVPAPERGKVLGKLGDVPDVRKAIADVTREVKRAERTEKLAAAAAPLDGKLGRFPILYADPPWRYEHVETESRAIENQYPTLDLGAICALDVRAICTDDVVLFLWATSPKLGEAFEVLKAWGFTYRTCLVWVKDKIGMGYYARQRHELLLVAVRGAPPTPPPSARPDSVIEAPRGEHSAKPEAVYGLIEAMYPTLPKVELFARARRDGWAAWGNEAGGR